MAKHFLGSIDECVPVHTPSPFSLTETSRSGFSDTTPTDIASPAESDEEEVFTYPAHGDNVGNQHHTGQEEEEEFVYPDSSADATLAARQDSIIASDDSPDHSQVSTVEPTTLVEAPDSLSSPLQATQASPHPSPAQLEALSAAVSQGDLVLLKELFATALQGGDVEAFALANDASSRTGFTPLHAAASRGYLDIIKWRESCFASQPCTSDHLSSVIEDCGAIPDLEDREGEVTILHSLSMCLFSPLVDCSTQSCFKWSHVDHPILIGKQNRCSRTRC